MLEDWSSLQQQWEDENVWQTNQFLVQSLMWFWKFISRCIFATWSLVPKTSARSTRVFIQTPSTLICVYISSKCCTISMKHTGLCKALVSSWMFVYPERGANTKIKMCMMENPDMFSFHQLQSAWPNSILDFENKFNAAFFLHDLLCTSLPSSCQGSDIRPM